jgi:hypothetical protein
LTRRLRLVALVLAVVLGTTACRVQTEIRVTVEENGSGTVTVGVGFDDDALRRVPNLLQSLRTDDLKTVGWTVVGPRKAADNLTHVEVSKNFANPDEASKVLSELSGSNGPFRDFAITRTRSFARTKFTFTGTVDFTAGLESFGDSELAAQLDGKPLGDDLQAIEQRIGEPLDDVFRFRISLHLPGEVKSNAPVQLAGNAIWQPRLSQAGPMQLKASSTSTRWQTLIPTILAVAAGVTLVFVLVFGLILGRRSRRRGASHVH